MLPTVETNLILDTDSYKASHWLQFPPNTTGMFSYGKMGSTSSLAGWTGR